MKHLLITHLLIFFGLVGFAQQPVRSDSTATATKSDSLKQPVTAVQQKPAGQPKTQQVRKDTRPLKDRIDWDFNTSFWVNTKQVYFNAGILVSYRFPKILSIGTGPVYVFSHRKDADVNLNGFGGQVFVRAQLIKFLYLWTSYQGLANQYITDVKLNPVSYTKVHGYVDSWYAGAGVNIHLGRRFGFNFSVLYDFLYNKTDSPFYSAVAYQFGFNF